MLADRQPWRCVPFPSKCISSGERVRLEAVPELSLVGPYRLFFDDGGGELVVHQYQIGQESMFASFGTVAARALHDKDFTGSTLHVGSRVLLEVENRACMPAQVSLSFWGRPPPQRAMANRLFQDPVHVLGPEFDESDFDDPALLQDPVHMLGRAVGFRPKQPALQRCLHMSPPGMGGRQQCALLEDHHGRQHQGWGLQWWSADQVKHAAPVSEPAPAPCPPTIEPPAKVELCTCRQLDTLVFCERPDRHEGLHRRGAEEWPDRVTPSREELARRELDRSRYLDDPDGWTAWESPTDES